MNIPFIFALDGPFLLLLVASLGSVVIAVLELIHYTYKVSKRSRKESIESNDIGSHYYGIHQRYEKS